MAESYKEKIDWLFDELEKRHINLYHDISKDEFNRRKNSVLQNIDSLDTLHVKAEILKLFALFKDAHTTFYFADHFVKPCVRFVAGKFYYFDTDKHVCEKITKVNGHDIKDVVDKLSELVCFECTPRLYRELQYSLRSPTQLKMIDCKNSSHDMIEYTLASGQKVCEYVSKQKKEKQNYSFFTKDNIVVVQLRKCYEDEKYPFKNFLSGVFSACTNKPSAMLVDLRNNGGGSSNFIHPLLDYIQKNHIKTYVLINDGTFSSAVINAVEMVDICHATLMGTPAAQAAHSYGEVREIKYNGISVAGYSNKYFNLTHIDTHEPVKETHIRKMLDYLGPVHPDIYIEEKIEDIRNGIDGQLRDALEIIESRKEDSQNKVL